MSDFVIEGGVLEKYTGQGGDVVIPEGVSMLWENAFAGNEQVTSVTIPEGVTRIHFCAFKGCRNLIRVKIPASVEVIAFNAFQDCTSLKEIEVDHRNGVFSSLDGILYEKGRTVLRSCPGGAEQIVLSAALEEIQRDA